MTRPFIQKMAALLMLCIAYQWATAQRALENLGRGLVAVHAADHQVFISWRSLATDPVSTAFNLYRVTGNASAVRLNQAPLTAATWFTDSTADLSKDNQYYVKALPGARETAASAAFTLPAQSPVGNYLTIPLHTPAGYAPNDAAVGDLDGDGEYELILHQAGRGKDNSQDGFTDPPVFQAYRLDGTLLWTINLGRNIREGAHYTQFMVYDLDQDGRAEIVMKTADGTVDGTGNVIGDSSRDWRNAQGRILDGPEYLTVFNGLTGAAMATVDYIPTRYPTYGWGGVGGNGGNDNKGNRVDRFLAAVAYLDGVHPSVIMCRGYYGRSVLAAWDWHNGKLTSRWVFDSKDSVNPYSGMGYHNLTVADVDQDGKDEIIYGSMAVDDDGTGLYTTGLRHGDALHVSDLDLSHPGEEVFGVHEIENDTKGPGVAVYDAASGDILWEGALDHDVGRGVAENIDADNPGAEMWWSGSRGLYNMKGERIGENPSSTNFVIWWDGDLTRELLNGTRIDKYRQGRLLTAGGCVANNGTKSTPVLSGDILGDWREEVIFRTRDNQSLRIYTTTIPTTHRLYTLMQDPQYRLSMVWQNVGYNQPPHTGFYMGEDRPVKRPAVTIIKKTKRNR